VGARYLEAIYTLDNCAEGNQKYLFGVFDPDRNCGFSAPKNSPKAEIPDALGVGDWLRRLEKLVRAGG
jgi:hypothetical protein